MQYFILYRCKSREKIDFLGSYTYSSLQMAKDVALSTNAVCRCDDSVDIYCLHPDGAIRLVSEGTPVKFTWKDH